MKLLLVLNFPEEMRNVYRAAIQEAFPDLEVEVVDHHLKVDPHIKDAHILVTFGAHVSDHVFQRAGKLRWVQALGTGVDGILDSPSLPSNVMVTNLRGLHGPSVSEAALASMLALSRDLPRTVRNQAAERWDRFPVRLLKGKSAGILGVGVIASELAPRLQALGMTVIGMTATPRMVAGFDRMVRRDQLLEVAPGLDFLVVLAPHTAKTAGIVSAGVLSRMKKSAILVNLARGGLVDESALVEALKARTIAGAALDVFAEEPLPEGHALWSMPNVLITPHMAGFHVGYPDDAIPIVVENIRRFLARDFDGMINVVRR
jgi:phosphoglycerate dehydrogenase-like enzyme